MKEVLLSWIVNGSSDCLVGSVRFSENPCVSCFVLACEQTATVFLTLLVLASLACIPVLPQGINETGNQDLVEQGMNDN